MLVAAETKAKELFSSMSLVDLKKKKKRSKTLFMYPFVLQTFISERPILVTASRVHCFPDSLPLWKFILIWKRLTFK